MAVYEIEFDYFHGYESEQFAFYRIPKILFTNDYFKELSCEAKVLYGLMLDRMALSVKNRWIDNKDRVYIIFTLEEVMQYMNCGRDKGMKTLAELDTKKGIGLIERVKQGFGKPDIIYIKSFLIKEKTEQEPENKEAGELVDQTTEVGDPDFLGSEKPTSYGRENRYPEVEKTDLPGSEKPAYRGRKNRLIEVGRPDSNYTDINKTDKSNPSIYPSLKKEEMMDVIEVYTEIVKDNIGYDSLVNDYGPHDKGYIDEMLSLLVEMVSIDRDTVNIAGADYPYQFVKNRFLKINGLHIRYVLKCLHDNTTKVRNIRSYLLTCLFNAPGTMGSYYLAEVNHDLYGMG